MKPSALFPESLRVGAPGAHLYTTSRKVAEHLELTHGQILRNIQMLISDLSAIGDDPETYVWLAPDKPLYHLSEDGFALLAMSLTGKAAEQWKRMLIAAFHQNKSQLEGAAP